jgi:hypothetical protein
MLKGKGSGLKDIAILSGVGVCIYLLFFKMNRKKAIKILRGLGINDPLLDDIYLYTDKHLIAWAYAAKAGANTYIYNGTELSTFQDADFDDLEQDINLGI